MDVLADCLVVVHLDREIVASIGWIWCLGVVGIGINLPGEAVQRVADRHGGFDPILAGLVAGGGDGAVGIGPLIPHPDDYGFASEMWPPEAFAGSIETIAIDMQDDRWVRLRWREVRVTVLSCSTIRCGRLPGGKRRCFWETESLVLVLKRIS